MTRDTHASRLCLKAKSVFKKLVSYDLDDSKDPEKPGDIKKLLQRIKLLEKLVFRRDVYVFGVFLIVAGYFLIWYNSECWALPFQESPCKRTRDLPLFATNQSTLAEAVDEFILALQTQIGKFRDTIELPDLADRQTFSNATKNEIGQLFSNYATDLLAFRALKREDERLKEMEHGIKWGYVIIISSLLTVLLLSPIILIGKLPTTEEMSAEENEYSQNVRLKNLKRRIPLLYIVTYIFITVEIALFVTIYAGHFYSGSSPLLRDNVKWNKNDCSNVVDNKNCTFTDYPSYATELEMILNKNLDKLDTFMASPILKVRQAVWLYESDVREAAIENHLDLKQYIVDRRTMPRKIGIVLPEPFSFVISLVIVIGFLRSYFSLPREDGTVFSLACFQIAFPETQES